MWTRAIMPSLDITSTSSLNLSFGVIQTGSNSSLHIAFGYWSE